MSGWDGRVCAGFGESEDAFDQVWAGLDPDWYLTNFGIASTIWGEARPIWGGFKQVGDGADPDRGSVRERTDLSRRTSNEGVSDAAEGREALNKEGREGPHVQSSGARAHNKKNSPPCVASDINRGCVKARQLFRSHFGL